MIIQYFEDTDTLYIQFNDNEIVETKNLDENLLLDIATNGEVSSFTIEHASKRIDLDHLIVKGLAAA